jgi:toxin FitB
MILLDTNVVSEGMRPHPDTALETWLQRQSRSEIWMPSVVAAEMLAGVESLPSGRKQQALREAVDAMITEDFRGQIVGFDLKAARAFGKILATRKKLGRPIRDMDAQIAAIASVHNAALATRNTRDFEQCGIKLINPWNTR